MPARQRATIADVAEAAQVSTATASRAFSRPELLTGETKDKVLAAAERLSYRPNRAARSLITGRTGMIGVIVPDIANPFFATIMRSAEREAGETGAYVLLADSGGDAEREIELVRALAPEVDGLLVCVPISAEADLVSAAGGTRMAFINKQGESVPSALIDQQAIVTSALAHLRELGHMQIAFAPGPPVYWSSGERAMAINHLQQKQLAIHVLGWSEPTFEGGMALVPALFESKATALIAFNDVMALGVIAALRDRGIRVPEDMSVIGSDDIPMAAMASPALTTVAAPMDDVTRAAMAVLHGNNKHPVQSIFQGEVIARASTAPPRTQGAV